MDLELTPAQMEKFYVILLDVFPSIGEFKRLVYYNLGENLDNITGGENFSEVIFDLLIWVKSKGKTRELLNTVYKERPENNAVLAFYLEVTEKQVQKELELSPVQMQEFQNALLSAFPRRGDLEQLVFFNLGVRLEQIVGQTTLVDGLFEVIQWARRQGRLRDLLEAAHKEVPGNPLLSVFYSKIIENRGSYITIKSENTLEGKKRDPVSKIKKIPTTVKNRLVELLCNLPLISTPQDRTILISSLPGAESLSRNGANARLDFEVILSQLQTLGQTSYGEWPILALIDNALPYVEGYELGDQLRAVREEIAAFYQQE